MITGAFSVVVAGHDVTNRMSPTLKSLSVTRAAREATDSAELSLADPDGMTFMPATGDPVEIHLGHTPGGIGLVFEGFVDSVRSTGGKSKGRELSIACKSVDNKSKVKAPGLRSEADKTFAEVAGAWGKKAGLTVTVAGDLGGVSRDYWIMQHESFMGWGQRMARELGASFKVIGKRGFFAPLNEGISATGKQLETIRGAWGQNLLDWDITPVIGRPQFGKVVGRYYDLNSAKWREVQKAVKDAGLDVDFRALLGAANEANADQSAGSSSKDSERERGTGSATIVGDWAAEPEAQFILSGARPGADGTYTIDALTHNLSKKGGFTTSLTLKRPTGGAGVDGR